MDTECQRITTAVREHKQGSWSRSVFIEFPMWHMVFSQKDSDKSFFAKVIPISFKDLTEGINWKLKSPRTWGSSFLNHRVCGAAWPLMLKCSPFQINFLPDKFLEIVLCSAEFLYLHSSGQQRSSGLEVTSWKSAPLSWMWHESL